LVSIFLATSYCMGMCARIHDELLSVANLSNAFGVDIPQADTSVMMPVLMGMLGLGGLSTFEKTKGINK
jgi:hypothetical protein